MARPRITRITKRHIEFTTTAHSTAHRFSVPEVVRVACGLQSGNPVVLEVSGRKGSCRGPEVLRSGAEIVPRQTSALWSIAQPGERLQIRVQW